MCARAPCRWRQLYISVRYYRPTLSEQRQLACHGTPDQRAYVIIKSYTLSARAVQHDLETKIGYSAPGT